jgi:hypothetical protein
VNVKKRWNNKVIVVTQSGTVIRIGVTVVKNGVRMLGKEQWIVWSVLERNNVKKGISFLCPLKQKLDDFRSNYISLDDMLEFLYSIDNKYEKKVVALQKKYKVQKLKEYEIHNTEIKKWRKQT